MIIVTLLIVGVGLANGSLIPKIVNGDDANIEDYPYQVSIEIDDGHLCGGSIISTDRILTAAHCTYLFPTSRIFVRAGSSIREQGGQRKSVAKNFVHPDWNKPPFDNDVAVLVLTEPLALNSEVQIVELATSNHVPVGAIATVTGWGKTENNTLATTLQKLETPKNSNTVCKQHYPFFNVNTMVCYGGVSGVSSCSADSGGPLVYNNVQVGIVSLGSIKCEGTSPTIYARVEHFLDYIQSNM